MRETRTVGIMQPYFFPYIGYFQLIAAVDEFVVYDDIKYTKKGWINRNRYLLNGAPATFTLPLASGSDELDIVDRSLAGDFRRQKLIAQLKEAYRKAPCFAETMPLVEQVISHEDNHLFGFLFNGLKLTCAHLGITTALTISSSLQVDRQLRAQERVIATCKATGANRYLNPIGGAELYDRAAFAAEGIELGFLRALECPYPQFNEPFVPWLSIIDVMMFKGVDGIRSNMLDQHEVI